MQEEFLHYVWKFQLFNRSNLVTTEGEALEILSTGLHNHDSGPDFFNGQVRLDKTRWAGNIELHLKASDWFNHNHQKDKLYDKIILHVVWEKDKDVRRSNGDLIPTLELKGLVSKSLLDKYEVLKSRKSWIPCEEEITSVDESIKLMMIDRMLVERLEVKSNRIDQLLSLNKNDWEATLYQLLAKYFGFKVNAVPFELLATSIPFSVFRKYQHNQNQLEALLFGQAGFLVGNCEDDYFIQLKKEYNFLQSKHQIAPLQPSLWKFMRMRPSNFPTVRIAQFAAVMAKDTSLFQKISEAQNVTQIKGLFNVMASTYWEAHFRFGVNSKQKRIKRLGKSSVEVLIINTIIPLLFNYGAKTGNEEIQERAIQFLTKLIPENNQLIKQWSSLGMPIKSAYETQGLIQLKTNYCDAKKCLNCVVGNNILKLAK